MTPDQREFARGVAYRALNRAVELVNEELGTDFVLADCEKTQEQRDEFAQRARALGRRTVEAMRGPN